MTTYIKLIAGGHEKTLKSCESLEKNELIVKALAKANHIDQTHEETLDVYNALSPQLQEEWDKFAEDNSGRLIVLRG